MEFHRRDIFKIFSFGAGAALIGRSLPFANLFAAGEASSSQTHHFFINIMFEGGWDPFYLFNCRPREFYTAGKMQNYFSANDHCSLWSDKLGNRTWVTRAFEQKFSAFRQDISLVNGMIMSPSFDGHDQNMNMFLTGNAFGGAYFLPMFNHRHDTPIDVLQSGNSFGTRLTNMSSSLPISSSTAKQLGSVAANLRGELDNSSKASNRRFVAENLVKSQFNRIAELSPKGLLGGVAHAALAGFTGSDNLAESLQTFAGGDDKPLGTSEDISLIKSVLEMFKRRISLGALLFLNSSGGGSFDTHSAEDASGQELFYNSIIERIAAIFSLLRDTPYDEKAGLSFLDVTTLVISSEFGRTMRQEGKAIDETGTDHNPLSNSAILAGKGIAGGLIIGASDGASLSGEEFSDISPAHKSLDPKILKTMGKPFDFDSGTVRSDQPESLNLAEYVTAASVVNTLMQLAGQDPTTFRKVGTQVGAPSAPVIKQLLV